MIFLFTDYGLSGPYLGQVESVLCQQAPEQQIINLMADCPRQNPKASAYLLAALVNQLPEQSIVFCVIDPGVGSFDDPPVVLQLDNRWYVGPDNGLFDIVSRYAKARTCWKINWRPDNLSASFHGRDLYAPVVAMLANGEEIPGEKITWKDRHNWPDQLNEIIYIDNFGNCMSGLSGKALDIDKKLDINGLIVPYAETFSAVNIGQAFWYSNSIGLIEISINQGSAAAELKLSIGSILDFS
jgi:S-adenosylmethionine hydrolase